MKLVKMAWVLGAFSSIALGMAAEACSSSDGGTTTTPPPGTGTNCATLSACCPFEPAGDVAACETLVTEANDSACLAYLTMGASAYCKAAPPGSGTSTIPPGSGTSTIPPGSGSSSIPPSSGSGTGVGGTDAGTCHAAPGMIYAETPDGGGFYCPFSKPDGGKTAYCTGGSQHCCEPTSTGLSTCSTSACGTGFTDWQCEGTPDCLSMPGTVCCGTGTINQQAACGAIPAYPYVSTFTGSSCQTSCTAFQICSQQSECSSGTCTAIEPKGNTIGYCAQ